MSVTLDTFNGEIDPPCKPLFSAAFFRPKDSHASIFVPLYSFHYILTWRLSFGALRDRNRPVSASRSCSFFQPVVVVVLVLCTLVCLDVAILIGHNGAVYPSFDVTR